MPYVIGNRPICRLPWTSESKQVTPTPEVLDLTSNSLGTPSGMCSSSTARKCCSYAVILWRGGWNGRSPERDALLLAGPIGTDC